MSRLCGLFLAALFISLLACEEEGIYFKEHLTINEAGWEYEDLKNFNFSIADTSSHFDLVLDLTHGTDYAFENTYVIVHTSFPSGKTISDKISLELATGTGAWLGKCSSKECTISLLLQERVKFPELGEYQIAFEQFNRTESIKALKNLSFKIYKSSI